VTNGGLLITVSGVDLAGKTTQLDALSRWLAETGTPATLLWHRPGYSQGLDMLRAGIRRLRPSALPRATNPEARARVFERRSVRVAWTAAACADTALQYGLRARSLRQAGRVVLCDRYLEDAILDLDLRFGGALASASANVLRRVCPVPDAAFLLMVPWLEVERRSRIKLEPFPDATALRRARHNAYARLAKEGRFIVIDAARPIDDVQHDLRAHIGRVRGK
jgi:thymidylate kinase